MRLDRCDLGAVPRQDLNLGAVPHPVQSLGHDLVALLERTIEQDGRGLALDDGDRQAPGGIAGDGLDK